MELREAIKTALDGRTNRWLSVEVKIPEIELSKKLLGKAYFTEDELRRIGDKLGVDLTGSFPDMRKVERAILIAFAANDYDVTVIADEMFEQNVPMYASFNGVLNRDDEARVGQFFISYNVSGVSRFFLERRSTHYEPEEWSDPEYDISVLVKNVYDASGSELPVTQAFKNKVAKRLLKLIKPE